MICRTPVVTWDFKEANSSKFLFIIFELGKIFFN